VIAGGTRCKLTDRYYFIYSSSVPLSEKETQVANVFGSCMLEYKQFYDQQTVSKPLKHIQLWLPISHHYTHGSVFVSVMQKVL